MEEITMYRAIDGKIFDNKRDCMKYEQRIFRYCFYREDCNGCPFWNIDRGECIFLDGIPADWH